MFGRIEQRMSELTEFYRGQYSAAPSALGYFYQCRYGDYLILMNCTDAEIYKPDIPDDLKNSSAKDLISGETYKLDQIAIPPEKTLVLYTSGSSGEEP